MHELAIAKGIIDIVSQEAQARRFTRVLAVTLSVGEYSGVVPECLEEFFPIAAAGIPAAWSESAPAARSAAARRSE